MTVWAAAFGTGTMNQAREGQLELEGLERRGLRTVVRGHGPDVGVVDGDIVGALCVDLCRGRERGQHGQNTRLKA